MRILQKPLCLLLAMAMMLSLSIAVFATGDNTADPPTHEMEGPTALGTADNGNGTITIQNASPNEKYQIYQIFYLESYTNAITDPPSDGSEAPKDELGNVTGGNYVYKINTAWTDFASTEAADYLTIDAATGIVTWKGDTSEVRVNRFAKLAMTYAKEQKIPAIQTGTCPEDAASLTFSGLKLGYYLVDSSLGVLCSLDTTNPNVIIKEKNKVPTNVKSVQEGEDWVSKNDAKIGGTVEFKSTVSLSYGIERFVFHDEMSAGLTFDPNSVSIRLDSVAGNPASYHETLTLTTHYSVVPAKNADGTTTALGDSCTFHIHFTSAFYSLLTSGDYTLTITYSATLNKDAVVGSAGNKNTSYLDYGDKNNTTPKSETFTRTWDIPVFKYTLTGTDETPLAGAIFKLSKEQKDTPAAGDQPAKPAAPIQLIDLNMKDIVVGKDPVTGNNITESWHCYRIATQAEIDDTKVAKASEITTEASGKFRIQGLDSNSTYYLHEVKAPDGFNELGSSIPIHIGAEGALTQGDSTTSVPKIMVRNGAGPELPGTGGIGTTIFYVVGSILLVGAGVLLIAKKRMASCD